jgi:hypothetical protein
LCRLVEIVGNANWSLSEKMKHNCSCSAHRSLTKIGVRGETESHSRTTFFSEYHRVGVDEATRHAESVPASSFLRHSGRREPTPDCIGEEGAGV